MGSEQERDVDQPFTIGEVPSLSEAEIKAIVGELNKEGHHDAASDVLEFWRKTQENREEWVKRYLGYMGIY